MMDSNDLLASSKYCPSKMQAIDLDKFESTLTPDLEDHQLVICLAGARVLPYLRGAGGLRLLKGIL